MKYIAALLFAFPLIATAQFNKPESVEYDAANQRWLVGNVNTGSVVAYSPASGATTPFCSGMTSGPYGIEILGNVLYCCDGTRVRGYNLDNGQQVFNLNLGATFLNGITTDGVDHLFVTDFSAKRIYRVNVTASSYNIMATIAKTPNGILYDGANQRCVFVTWGSNAAVQTISLVDSTVATLYTTALTNLDGIARDPQGNWYVSTWGTQTLQRFDPSFSTNPVAVLTGLSSPADLGVNAAGDSIAVPNSGTLNNVVFYAVPGGGCPEPQAEALVTAPACHGDIGTIVITVTSGTAPFTFAWTSGSTDQNLIGVAAGNYIVTVTDNDGCTTTVNVTMPQPTPVSAAIVSSPSYIPPCNGTISVLASGGVPPYAVTVNGDTALYGLCPGWYDVTIEDANGCVLSDSVLVEFISSAPWSILAKPTLSVRPNPSSGNALLIISGGTISPVTPHIAGGLQNANLVITDATGRTVLNTIVRDRVVILSGGLAPGLYGIALVNGGVTVATTRWLVQ